MEYGFHNTKTVLCTLQQQQKCNPQTLVSCVWCEAFAWYAYLHSHTAKYYIKQITKTKKKSFGKIRMRIFDVVIECCWWVMHCNFQPFHSFIYLFIVVVIETMLSRVDIENEMRRSSLFVLSLLLILFIIHTETVSVLRIVRVLVFLLHVLFVIMCVSFFCLF